KKLLKHPWIVNSKRTDSVVRQPTMKYDDAIKSVQEWNEALRSPNAGSMKRPHRNQAGSPVPRRYAAEFSTTLTTPTKGPFHLPKPNANTEAFRSPEHTVDEDNWDDDFATSISPSALKLSSRMKL